MSCFLSDWPWAYLGTLKYVLYGPLVAKAVHTNLYGGNEADNWCFHILLLTFLRYVIYQLWATYSNMYCLSAKYKICKKDAEFDQMDREWDWDNFLLLQAFMATAAHHFLPFFRDMPAWNAGGLIFLAILHMGPAEALYYWAHRAFHKDILFQRYHSLHHAAFVLQPQTGQVEEVPDYVFLAHIVDVLSSLHVRFLLRGFCSTPFATWWFLLPLWPVVIPFALAMWVWAKPFVNTGHRLKGRLHQTWIVPRFGFQYFIPFAQEGINNLIQDAILSADKMGVKVISLAALNKNEALNGGGTLFVKRLPNLRVRVVHGNTLTAAVILNELNPDVKEVFLTGATSKLGRAIALYLCKKRIRVMMLTCSEERFKSIQSETPPEFQNFLVQVTKYQVAQNCKTWIVGKWIAYKEQKWAPVGCHLHQFVVPPIFELRKDCTYGKLAGMQLPDAVEGLSTCEYTMPRRCVHACHAGGILHSLEGWEHHEVGAIDVNKIDMVWEAALKHGFKPMK